MGVALKPTNSEPKGLVSSVQPLCRMPGSSVYLPLRKLARGALALRDGGAALAANALVTAHTASAAAKVRRRGDIAFGFLWHCRPGPLFLRAANGVTKDNTMRSPLRPLLALLCACSAAASTPLIDIFTSGTSTNSWSKGKAVTYRIPCLVESNGVLLALVSERLASSSDESDTNLVQRRSTDAGATWSNTTLVVSAEVDPPFAAKHAFISSAPWAVADATIGDVLMFYNQNAASTGKCLCNVWYVRTSDGGLSWSKPVPIPPSSGVYGSSLNTGITLRSGEHKGRLVMCMRRICKNSCPGPWQSYAAYSDDHGLTWSTSPFLEEGSTECQVAELSTGDVYVSLFLSFPLCLPSN